MKKRFKFPLYFFSFLIFVCLTFWVLLTQTRLLENQVNRLLNVFLQTKYSLKLQLADISGSFWRELKVKNITVDLVYEDEEYRIAEIPQLKVNYKLSNLWRRKWIIDSLTFDHPRFTLVKTEEGRLLLAVPSTERKVISKTGLFDFTVGNLRIDEAGLEFISPEGRTPIDSLNLELSISRDEEGIKLNITRGGFEFPQKDFVVRHLSGSFHLRKDTLSIKAFRMQTEDTNMEIFGDVTDLKNPKLSLSAIAKPIDLQDIAKLTGIGLEGVLDLEGTCEGTLKRFEGKASLDGLFFGRRFEPVKTTYVYQNEKLIFPSISGKAFGSPINGKGDFDFSVVPEKYEFNGEVKNLNIDNIVFGSLETDFSGRIHMQGKSTAAEELFMQAEVDLQEGRLEQYRFHAAKGILDITAKDVTFHPEFQLRYKNTGIAVTGKLEYDGQIDIDSWIDFRDLKDFMNQIFIKEMRGRGRAFVNFGGRTADFDIKGEFTSDSCYAYELFSSDARIELDIANFLGKRKGEVDVRFFNGDAWGVDYDSLISRLEIDDQLIKIDSIHLGNDYLSVNSWGELDISQIPEKLLVYEIVLDYRGNRLVSTSPMVADLDTDRVRISKCVLCGESGEIEVSGEIDYEQKMDLDVEVSQFDIAPWAALLSSEPIEGRLSFAASLGGDFFNPEIIAKGQVEQLQFQGMELGNLKMELRYKGKSLQISNLVISDGEWKYTLQGFVPLDLSFVAVEQRILDEPQDFRFQAEGKRLELIKLFIPDIEYLTGDFEGDLSITGSLLHPRFDGKATLKDGQLKFAQLFDPVEELQVEMRMKDEDLILDKISGFMESQVGEGNPLQRIWSVFSPKEKVRGEVIGFGTINLKDVKNIYYDLYFSGDRVPISYEYADLFAIADASVEITGQTSPLVTAQIFLPELFYRESFSTSGSGKALSPAYEIEDLWDWNLDISMTNNCWIINEDVNMEFRGDVRVLREKGQLNILGNLETIRGKYFLYGTKFNIEQGTFFFDRIDQIDPKIDFLVSSRLWGGSSGSSGGSSLLSTSSSNELRLAIKGTLLKPEVEPAPGSPYSKEDVVELLAFQQDIGVVDSTGVGSLFQERVVKSLGGAYSSRLLENIAGRTLGVETFEIVPTWSEKFRLTDAQITIGKYISDKVYLRYTRRLSQSSGQETGVEYRLNKHLLLEGRKDKLGLFHLGLNLNWEY
jgi:hypothetical protein